MLRLRATSSLLLASVAACSSDPTVPADPDTSMDEGTTAALDGDTSTGSDGGTTTATTAALDDDTSTGSDGTTTGSEGTQTDGSSSTGDTDGSSTGTDTGEPEPICGDGMIGGDEACDDAGESAACNADCTLVACGDGTVNATAGEACDDAGESPTCNADCTLAACGDGLVNGAAGELCDDAGESAACNVGCTPAACGDGIFNASAGEACDDAGRTAACNTDCTLATCGDGVLNVMAGEACDDAGESPVCNASCTLAACGDGVTNLTAGEACDDAGFSVACNADCSATTCGDSIVNPVAGEECEADVLDGATCQGEGFYGGALACDAGCSYATDGCYDEPGVPTLTIGYSQVKRFDFSWPAVLGAEQYELLERATPGDPLVPIATGIVGESISLEMPLHLRHQASYVLRACNGAGCTDSLEVSVVGSLAQAIGYFKASNTEATEYFGWSVALSGDGNTLAVGAYYEDSNATGINGNQGSNAANTSGAVYVYTRTAIGQWSQQAYVKASNTGSFDWFGWSVALSNDGDTLAVSARQEESNATGINGAQFNNSASASGAVYVLTRNAMDVWSQQAYVKASNTGSEDIFGYTLDLSGDGNTLVVGAVYEDSNATGIGGNQANNLASGSGAVYVYARSGMGVWAQQAYVKASNTNADDNFGTSVALSDDGDTLAVGALYEDSNATGIGGNQADNSAGNAGAVYVFTRNPMHVWSQQAYVKASNPGPSDNFGHSLALSGDGNTLAVGARYEDSNATGIDGDQANNAATDSGAVYVFVRDDMSVWTQQAYVKSSNSATIDWFGASMALSGDGSMLAVGAQLEDGITTGVGGNQADDSALNAGAVFVLVRDGGSQWSQRAYVKSANTGAVDEFGVSTALSTDGRTLAVGSHLEDGAATGVGGDQTSETASAAGAVYVY